MLCLSSVWRSLFRTFILCFYSRHACVWNHKAASASAKKEGPAHLATKQNLTTLILRPPPSPLPAAQIRWWSSLRKPPLRPERAPTSEPPRLALPVDVDDEEERDLARIVIAVAVSIGCSSWTRSLAPTSTWILAMLCFSIDLIFLGS